MLFTTPLIDIEHAAFTVEYDTYHMFATRDDPDAFRYYATRFAAAAFAPCDFRAHVSLLRAMLLTYADAAMLAAAPCCR